MRAARRASTLTNIYRGNTVADAGAVLDEPGGEVTALEERAVADEQGDRGFEWVEPGGAGMQGHGEVVSVHAGLWR